MFVIGLIALAVFGMLVYMAAAWGFVIAKMWTWFLTSQFGLQAITFHQGLALGIMLTLFTMKVTVPANELFDQDLSKKYKWNKFTYYVIAPWCTLLIGYILKLSFF
jgi:hypothetical protein